MSATNDSANVIRSGKIVIPIHFAIAEEFSKEGLAVVLDEQGWAYIDRTGQVLVCPIIFDNSPDYFREALARLTANGKVGLSI